MHATLPPNEVTHNYSLFLFCGFLPWLLFQETVVRSASSLLENTNLITKTVFPSEIVPVSIFLSSLISHLMALVLVIAVVGFYNGHFSLWMFSLPIYMVLIGLFSIGVGWFVSSLQVYLRDTAQVISVVLTFWCARIRSPSWCAPIATGCSPTASRACTIWLSSRPTPSQYSSWADYFSAT
jgi:ABC-type polysaccharide/polyol phosphate export permease